MLFGEPFWSKAPPLDFLNCWLLRHGLPSSVLGKYVRMDQGGELGRCPAVVSLFEQAGYSIELTAPDALHQNGPGERPHRTIGDAIRTMLAGANLEPRFWPFAFRHYLHLYNVIPHSQRSQSPYTCCTGKQPDLTLLRTFGCRVYVLPPRATRRNKLQSDTRTGIFLGYSQTHKNILYFDTHSNVIKTALHVVFDEAMNDCDHKSPNARLLCGDVLPPADVLAPSSPLPFLDITSTPFLHLVSLVMPFDPDNPFPLGFEVSTCSRLRWAYISAFHRSPLDRTLRAVRRSFLGSYLVSLADVPVFLVTDLAPILHSLRASAPSTFTLVLAPERRSSFDDRPTPTLLRSSDLCHLAVLRSSAGVGKVLDLPDLSSLIDQLEFSVCRLQSSTMTQEECDLPRLTL